MAVQFRKPILVTGVGLSFLLWIGTAIQDSLTTIGEWGIPAAIALGTSLWWWRQSQQKKNSDPPVVQKTIDREAVDGAIAEAKTVIDQIASEAPETKITDFQQRLEQLSDNLNRDTLNIAITGGQSVGKSSLNQCLDVNSHQVIETPPLYQTTEMETIEQIALPCELVIFVVNGDITDSEYQTLQRWRHWQQTILVVFNKQDHYSSEEQAVIYHQLQNRLNAIIPETDIFQTSAAPAPIKVRQFQADNTQQEWEETRSPEVKGLQTRLNHLLHEEKLALIYQSTWRQAHLLKQQAKTLLNQCRRERAMPIIEQYQWVAAGTAFANPVSSLDLLATAAINTQLVVDLGKIYQQKISWEQAQTVAGTLGKQMVQLGLVEFSTQTMTSFLKSNAITYVAGGTVQGLSAAYLTRIAGLSLTEYFQEQDITQPGEGLNRNRLQEKLQTVFQNNQRTALLKSLFEQGKQRLFQQEGKVAN